jgi:hypothetical protein
MRDLRIELDENTVGMTLGFSPSVLSAEMTARLDRGKQRFKRRSGEIRHMPRAS